MNPTETEAAAGADTLLAVVEQLVRDTGHGRALHASLDSSFERDLDLGECRDGYPQRQFLVEDVILPHVAVGQHVVPEPLRVPQACAMPQH